MVDERVTVGGAVRYAFTLFGSSWRLIWGALALCALANVVYLAGWLSSNAAVRVVGWFATLPTTVMLSCAVFRIAMRQRHGQDPDFVPGALGLQWRAMEWRVLAAILLVQVFTYFLGMLGALVIMGVLSGVLQSAGVPADKAMTAPQIQAAVGTGGLAILAMALLGVCVIAVYLSLRLSLAQAATADEGAVRVLRTWKLTRSRCLPIFASLLLVSVPWTFLAALVAATILGAGGVTYRDLTVFFSGSASIGANPEALVGAAVVGGFVSGGLIQPLMSAVTAYFHQGLSSPPTAGSLPQTR